MSFAHQPGRCLFPFQLNTRDRWLRKLTVRPQRPNCRCFLLFFQEVSSLGLQSVWTSSNGGTEINVVSLLNCTYDLIQLHHKSLRSLENLEVENLRSSNNMESLQLIRARLKVSNMTACVRLMVAIPACVHVGQVTVLIILSMQEQLEVSKRENTGLLERERGLLQQVKSLQNALKNEKEEVIFRFLEASWLCSGSLISLEVNNMYWFVLSGAQTAEHNC